MSSVLARLSAVAASAALLLAVSAAAAGASVTVNDTTPSNGQSLTATIASPPAGATQYTLAECNVTDPDAADWGRDCNGVTALSFAPVSTTSRSITVNRSFTNVSFVPGQSPQFGATTTCRFFGGMTSQCAVVASYYNASFAHLGSEKVNIFF